MSEFNPMTVVAAAKIISGFQSHSEMDVLEVQWGIAGRVSGSNKSARVADLARMACEEEIEVLTEGGRVHLSRVLVEFAISVPEHQRQPAAWKTLVAGLRFDGFEVRTTQVEPDLDDYCQRGRSETTVEPGPIFPGR